LKCVPDSSMTCCVLHNICISMHDNTDDHAEQDINCSFDQDGSQTCTYAPKRAAVQKRDNIVTQLFAVES
jgi:hypothetical protein